jgi:hypothetical protein
MRDLIGRWPEAALSMLDRHALDLRCDAWLRRLLQLKA